MADKKMSIVFDASMNIAQVKTAVGEIQKSLSGVTMPQNISTRFEKTISKLSQEIATFEQQAAKGLTNATDFSTLTKSGQQILKLYGDLQSSARQLGNLSDRDIEKLFPVSVAGNIEKANKALTTYNATLQKNQTEITKQNKTIDTQQGRIDELNKKMEAVKAQTALPHTDYKALETSVNAAEAEVTKLEESLTKAKTTAETTAAALTKPGRSSIYRAQVKEVQELENKLGTAKVAATGLRDSLDSSTTIAKQNAELKKYGEQLATATTDLEKMQTALQQMKAKDPQAFATLAKTLSKISGIDLSAFSNDVEGMQAAIQKLQQDSLAGMRNGFNEVQGSVEQAGPAMAAYSSKVEEAASSQEQFNRQARDIDSLKQRVQYFFGLTNSINLFKKAVTSAIGTVKELDAAMTETAVVTDFSVGDMWAALPQYTKTANELGTTTLGAYETMTLFYQQGLDTNEAFQLGTETMKMARIAGMDYTEATNMMTAALRGFNMELNNTSAERVNDVYSELAAITASDTQEISTAMTKTASIAHNANMEFETTAAFLSQIIETTRESAETAGTAMKTVIARFQELKKDPALIEDVDGEMVDANKIEAALRTVQVSLRDTSGQFRDLDDVFLDIAQKWDEMDTNTQRYIATMAAGSRQQSRFIAMMSDYDRTMELVKAANDSAGSSQRQFEKTTESLESKLNQLNNAWGAFTMGIANQSLIKGGVDALTGLLNVINNVTDVLPDMGSNFAKLGVTLVGLKAGGKVFDSFFMNLKQTGGAPFAALGKTATDTFKGIRNQFKTLKATLSKEGLFSHGNMVDSSVLTNLEVTRKKTQELKRDFQSLQAAGASGAELTAAYQNMTTASAASTAAMQGLISATGASTAQVNAFKIASEATNDVQLASIALTDKEVAAKILSTGATQGEITAEQAEAISQELVNSKKQAGLLIRIREGIIRVGTAIAQKLNIGLLTAEAAGETALGIAIGGKNVQMLISLGIIGAIIVAAIALIAIIYLIAKAIHDSNPNVQLEKAKDAANDAADAADAAADAYKNLKDSIDALGDSYSNIESLTRGTEEWREAVVSTNNQVLDLIGQYKELAGLVTNTGGVLTIDTSSDEVQDVISNYERAKYLADSASAAASAKVEQKQRDADYYNLDWNAKVNAERDGVVTANKDLTNSLAKAIARGEVRDRGEGTEVSIRDWLSTQDLGAVSDTQLDTFASNLANASGQLRVFGNELLTSEAAEEVYTGVMLSSAMQFGRISEVQGGNYVENLDTGYLSSQMTKVYDDALSTRTDADKNMTDETRKEYAKMMGYESFDKNTFTDSEGNERTLTDDDIYKQLAGSDATQSMSQTMEELAGVFQGIPGLMRDEVANILSTDGMGIDKDLLAKYSGEFDQEAFAIDAGFLGGFEEMAQAFGLSVEDMLTLVGDNFASANDRIVKQRQKLVGSMKKSSKQTNTSYKDLAKQLQELESRFEEFGINFQGMLEGVFNTLGMSGDQAVVDAGYQEFMKVAENDQTGEQIKDLNSFINNVDWSNPIEAASALNNEIENGIGASKDYAKTLLEVGNSAFGAGAQMQYFLKSTDFQEMSEDLTDIISKNDQLVASDILSLADDYKSLDKIMKNTGATASGLAAALTKIQKGELNMNQMTDAVLASLGAFDSLDDAVARIIKTLADFDPGVNENDIADFISGAYDTINENLEKGAVGNSQIGSYMDFFFGPDWDKGDDGVQLAGDALVERQKYFAKELEKNSTDMQASFVNLANGVDVYGKALEAGSMGSLSVVDTGSNIQLTGFEGMTTNQIVETLADAYNVSHDYATMMLADFKNYSADLAQELQTNDLAAGLDAAWENVGSTRAVIGRKDSFDNGEESAVIYNTKSVIDEAEIQAISDIFQAEDDEVRQYFADKGAIITDFYDEEGFARSTSEIIDQLNSKFTPATGAEAGSQWIEGFASRTKDGKAIVNYNEIQKALADLNIPESTRAQLTTDLMQALDVEEGIDAQLDVTLSDGSTTRIDIEPNIDVATAIANAEQDLQNSKLAEAIAEAFGEVTINFAAEEGDIATVVEEINTAVEAGENEVPVTINEGDLETLKTAITSGIEGLDNITPVDGDTTQLRLAIDAEGKKSITVKVNYNTSSKPDAEYARGIKNASSGHMALLGDGNGPELVQTADGAYIAGQDGPTMGYINKGDTVYTAEETRRILSGQSSQNSETFPRYATGYNRDWGYIPKNTRDSSGGGDEADVWENPYDWLYNLTEKINENLRERNLLEKRFQLLQKRGRSDAQSTIDFYNEQNTKLKEQSKLQSEMLEKRQYEMRKFLEENAEMNKYGTFNWDTGTISMDWNLIESVKDTEAGERVEDYISELEEIQDQMDDAEEALIDIELEIEDIKQELINAYLEFEDRVAQALENIDQKAIDELKKVYDAIDDANSDLVKAIKENIDKMRQDRKNEESEEDIAKKERRLAYLRQDTSGANSLEIIKLEEELAEARQDYQDDLVDQALDNLQAQNDVAAEQREKQIALMQSQLEWNVQNGIYAAQVSGLLEAAFKNDHFLTEDDELWQILYDGEGWGKLTHTALREMIKQAQLEAEKANAAVGVGAVDGEKGYNINTDYSALMQQAYQASGGKMTNEIYSLNAQRNAKLADNPELAEKYSTSSWTNTQAAAELAAWYAKNGSSNNSQSSATTPTSAAATPTAVLDTTTKQKVAAAIWRGAYGWGTGTTRDNRLAEVFGSNSGIQSLVNSNVGKNDSAADVKNYSYALMRKKFKGYKQGGLADFTGPAWLDGTKSKPEAVLDATDTQALIQLRDVLRGSVENAAIKRQGGDTFQFDIEIKDPHLSNDYDTDDMIRRVEQDIHDKAVYRNINAVSRTR